MNYRTNTINKKSISLFISKWSTSHIGGVPFPLNKVRIITKDEGCGPYNFKCKAKIFHWELVWGGGIENVIYIIISSTGPATASTYDFIGILGCQRNTDYHRMDIDYWNFNANFGLKKKNLASNMRKVSLIISSLNRVKLVAPCNALPSYFTRKQPNLHCQWQK